MRKRYIFLTLLICVLLSSCKKGVDDPAFTLLSRKARLAGDWKFQNGNITIGIKDSTGAYSAQEYKLSDTKYTYDEVGRGAHFEEPCSLHLIITKNGSFSIDQTMDSLKFVASGSWDFDKKAVDYKNKERFTVQLKSIVGYSNYFRFFNKSQTTFTYAIKELKNKKLVLVSNEEMVMLEYGVGIYITSEYTFVQ